MSSRLLSDYAEAVFVLANLMDRHGRLNEDSEARLALAAALVEEKPFACLITSGWAYRSDSKIVIADAMRDTARQRYGIAGHRIFSDGSARDTVGDAIFVKRNLVEPSTLRTLTIVSSDYHMRRVREIFGFMFADGYMLRFVSAPDNNEHGKDDAEMTSLQAFYATFAGVRPGDTEAIYQRLVRNHPLYNGEVYPAF